jgi:ATP-binding cassette, subfamily B, bacterial
VQQGEIRWNGVRLDSPSDALGPPRTGYVPQAPRLFSSSLRENILLGHPADDEALHRALHAAVLETDLSTMPEGLETPVGPRGMRLSGGQVQRAAIARMLVRAPELMVLDDVSSALDVTTEQLLWERLLALADATCVAVTHRRRVLERADRVLVMDAGRVVAEGTVAHLLATSAAFGEIWRTASGD